MSVFLSCVYSETEEPIARHFHSVYELIYIVQGAARFTIGDSCYQADAGSLLLISKLEEHDVQALRRPYRRYYLQLTPAQLERCLPDPRLRWVFVRRTQAFRHCFDLGEKAAEAHALLRQMTEEWQNPGPFCEERLSSLLTLLLILCQRQCPNQFPAPSRNLPDAVSKAQQYLDRHFAESVSLETLAGQLFISPSYLSHAFRQWTGYSPKRYLMLCRLSHARQLLLDTNAAVGEVSLQCGFQDVNNFIRAFRQETGLTPAAYRKQKQ